MNPMVRQGNDKIFGIDEENFEPLALEVFHYQYAENRVYRDYVNALKVNAQEVRQLAEIPFLPIRFFKSHRVVSGSFEPEAIFESSGTTGMVNSRHEVKDLHLYTKSFSMGFDKAYGNVKDYCILGLLPSYLERSNSSLVHMVDWLIKHSGSRESGFYLNDRQSLASLLVELEMKAQKTLLIGVSFALLDFAAEFPLALNNTIIMETGGMKGRRKEMVREEMHEELKRAFKVTNIHSEYGMTELLSQAYSKGEGLFTTPPWMRILIRDESDPLAVIAHTSRPQAGAINIIDLANVDSCSFIATDDAGRLHPGGKFEVMGRLDGSDLRGCSLLVV